MGTQQEVIHITFALESLWPCSYCSHIRNFEYELLGKNKLQLTSAAPRFAQEHRVIVPINTYSMKTYVLLHFEHKNYVTIIVKLLYRAASRRK